VTVRFEIGRDIAVPRGELRVQACEPHAKPTGERTSNRGLAGTSRTNQMNHLIPSITSAQRRASAAALHDGTWRRRLQADVSQVPAEWLA
jgi:hypothetical protein